MINQRGFAPVLILILLGVALLVFVALQFFNPFQKTGVSKESSVQSEDINDPKYDLVKDKYNLNEEQLKILSTVDEDREL